MVMLTIERTGTGTSPGGAAPRRTSTWVLLLAVTLLALLAMLWSVPGARAAWTDSETVYAGTISTGALVLAADGEPSFTLDGYEIDPALDDVCVGNTLRMTVPVRTLTSGSNTDPVLTRSLNLDLPAHAGVTDVTLDEINEALVVSDEEVAHLVQLDITSSAPGTVVLDQDLMLSDRPGSERASSLSGRTSVVFEPCGGQLVTTWDTTLSTGAGHDVSLGLTGAYGWVTWGDGSPAEAITSTTMTYDYAQPGTYTVTATGVMDAVSFPGPADALVSVDRWDDATETRSITDAFRTAHNLRSAVSPPSTVASMVAAFQGSRANPVLHEWRTTNVKDMSHLFHSATRFTGDVSAWDTQNVTSMSYMFNDATSFAGDLSAWSTGKVVYMNTVFGGAVSFDSDISRWSTGTVANMQSMFLGATSFSGDLSGWKTSTVTHMSNVFNGATSFRSSVASWDTSGATTMDRMFAHTVLYDDDLSGWDTSSVTVMTAMFHGAAAFTGDLSGWDVSGVPSKPVDFMLDANPAMVPPVWGTAGTRGTGMVVDAEVAPDQDPVDQDATGHDPVDTGAAGSDAAGLVPPLADDPALPGLGSPAGPDETASDEPSDASRPECPAAADDAPAGALGAGPEDGVQAAPAGRRPSSGDGPVVQELVVDDLATTTGRGCRDAS